jgi:hypothetical protein
MAKIHKSNSPYFKTPIKDFYLDVWKKRNIPASADDQLITLEAKYEGRPDLLSYDLYGTPRLWWVFAVRNMDLLVDPIEDMKAGITIFAPTKDRIVEFI